MLCLSGPISLQVAQSAHMLPKPREALFGKMNISVKALLWDNWPVLVVELNNNTSKGTATNIVKSIVKGLG